MDSGSLGSEFDLNSPAEEPEIRAAEIGFGKVLPEDFKKFLLTHDGGEGFIGEHYLVLWKSSDLLNWNRDYQFEEYAPGFIAFGSNGGGDAFAFDTRSEPYRVVMVPFIGMSLADGIPVAPSLTGLLERMKTVSGSLF